MLEDGWTTRLVAVTSSYSSAKVVFTFRGIQGQSAVLKWTHSFERHKLGKADQGQSILAYVFMLSFCQQWVFFFVVVVFSIFFHLWWKNDPIWKIQCWSLISQVAMVFFLNNECNYHKWGLFVVGLAPFLSEASYIFIFLFAKIAAVIIIAFSNNSDMY